jgi:hypothetical protein
MPIARMTSFLGAMVVASGAWVLAAPAAFANDYDTCLQGAHHAGLHKPDATSACEQGEAGKTDDCAAMIAKDAKPPVKDNPDAAKAICGQPAEPPED